jgi:transposase
MKETHSTNKNTINMPVANEQKAGVLVDENTRLKEEVQSLKNLVAWFENQIFGQKSEKRISENPLQGDPLRAPVNTEPEKPAIKKVAEYERGKAKKKRPDDCNTDVGLRFSDEVPVEVINITPPELAGSDADQYKIIDTKITRKLAKLPASYIMLEYHLPMIKKLTVVMFVPPVCRIRFWIAA